MAVPADPAEAELQRQLAGLSLSEVEPSGPGEAIQAVVWWNHLARLGMDVPLLAVHDLGLLLAGAREGRPHRLGPGPRDPAPGVRGQYRSLLASVAGSDVITELATGPLLDETVAVVLARALSDIVAHTPPRPSAGLVRQLPVSSPLFDADRAALAREIDLGWMNAFLQRLRERERGVLARLDQIDLGALRLMGLFPVDTGVPELVDLYQVVGASGVADVVDFALTLLPSLLETKRRHSVQRFSIDGYASIDRRGSLDALLPGELAHDADVFALKALSDDLLYYAHERAPRPARPLRYILVDASASMRGARQVFARGLALALCRKLSLQGGEVWLRFFDSRLSDRMDVRRAARRELPRLLSYRSERGRNYARVFADLAAEVATLRRTDGRDVAITFITHAECHIPRATVERLARDATLFGVFVLPSRTPALDYLPLLSRAEFVTADVLARAATSRRRALDIVEDAGRRAVGG